MSDDNIINNPFKKLFIITLLCLLFIVVLFFVIVDSPKFILEKAPDYISAEEISSDADSQFESSKESDGVFPIKINTATSEELQLIPNIGPATAKLIIDYRNEYGTILSLDELLSIDGIGKKTVEVLKEYCIIN